MSFLLEKSKQNKAAFALLTGLDHYASAVHCGYYCCIQKIIYILKEYYTDEYEAGLAGLKGGHGNRHKFYIEEFAGRFSKDIGERRRLKNLLTELKHCRIEADYHDVQVTDSRIKKVKSYLEEILRLIRKNLGL